MRGMNGEMRQIPMIFRMKEPAAPGIAGFFLPAASNKKTAIHGMNRRFDKAWF
jgi:hypothetical protein